MRSYKLSDNQPKTPYKLLGVSGVYVIHLLSNENSFKIGYSLDLYSRLIQHRVKYKKDMVVDFVLACSNPNQVEENLHRYFEDKRIGSINSEWFSLSADDLRFIKSIEVETISSDTLTYVELYDFKRRIEEFEQINSLLLQKRDLDPELELAFLAISLMIKPLKETVRLHARHLFSEKVKRAMEPGHGKEEIDAVRILTFEE